MLGQIFDRASAESGSDFHFMVHASGEAEAKYALLQKEGVVDAVSSEDLDTVHSRFHTVVDVASTNLDRPVIDHNS